MGGGVSGPSVGLGLNERAWRIRTRWPPTPRHCASWCGSSRGAACDTTGVSMPRRFGAGRALSEICTAGFRRHRVPAVPIGG